MTNNELKTALQNQCPVVCRSVRHGETRYKCVNAIRYTLDRAKQLIIQAELLDYNNNSITIVSGKFEKMKKGGGSAVAYAWFEWEKGYNGYPIIKWIN